MTRSSHPTPRLIGDKTFTEADQALFASISADHNPMHVDPVVARRLLTGKPVVHGMHTLLTAIEYWQNDPGAKPTGIRCSFASSVSVGECVTFTQEQRSDDEWTIHATVDGLQCAQIDISTAREAPSNPDASSSQTDQWIDPLRHVDRL